MEFIIQHYNLFMFCILFHFPITGTSIGLRELFTIDNNVNNYKGSSYLTTNACMIMRLHAKCPLHQVFLLYV